MARRTRTKRKQTQTRQSKGKQIQTRQSKRKQTKTKRQPKSNKKIAGYFFNSHKKGDVEELIIINNKQPLNQHDIEFVISYKGKLHKLYRAIMKKEGFFSNDFVKELYEPGITLEKQCHIINDMLKEYGINDIVIRPITDEEYLKKTLTQDLKLLRSMKRLDKDDMEYCFADFYDYEKEQENISLQTKISKDFIKRLINMTNEKDQWALIYSIKPIQARNKVLVDMRKVLRLYQQLLDDSFAEEEFYNKKRYLSMGI